MKTFASFTVLNLIAALALSLLTAKILYTVLHAAGKLLRF